MSLPSKFTVKRAGHAMLWLRLLMPLLLVAAFGLMSGAAAETMSHSGQESVSISSPQQGTSPGGLRSEIVAKTATCSPFAGCNVLLAPSGWDWHPALNRPPFPPPLATASPGYELMPPVPPPRAAA